VTIWTRLGLAVLVLGWLTWGFAISAASKLDAADKLDAENKKRLVSIATIAIAAFVAAILELAVLFVGGWL
jgi:hypothetical protein